VSADPHPHATSSATSTEPLLEVRNLLKHFPIRKGIFGRTVGHVQAVNDISFTVGRGETLGLVGESGSGKSTTARLALKLLDPTAGSVHFDGTDLTELKARELKQMRKRMQIVFQDPYGSLSPRMRVSEIISEPLRVHGVPGGKSVRDRVGELLEIVGLSGDDRAKYPHQFSGGQAQRIGIARALATDPELIVCDEAVSALDVSVQAQILNLLKRLQRELGLSYLFIAHDLNVVRYMSDEVCVMYLGEIVERGPGDRVFEDPQHPYTQMLLGAVATSDPIEARANPRVIVNEEVPSPSNPPPGCRFHTRCPHVMDRCRVEIPAQLEVGPGRVAACHLLEERKDVRS
jgi:oligopeptide/dipeptide ABC transporter ATP-binding protein